MRFDYSKWKGPRPEDLQFLKQMMEIYRSLLLQTGGDVDEALKWMEHFGEQYGFFGEKFGIDDFKKMLEDSGEAERTPQAGKGGERLSETRAYQFGDDLGNLDPLGSVSNAVKRGGIDDLSITEEDLSIYETEHLSSCATVLMVDVSHSMILYGEDRFTPAKKVALALAHLIRTQYPGDSLKIVLFHDSAEELPIARLATTQVGPYHTNTAEGLKLARRILTAQRKEMKQIVMVTDGKPTAAFMEPSNAAYFGYRKYSSRVPGEKRLLYKNSMGNDPFVMAETFKEVQACRKAGIMINTFMLASDYYLVDFVKRMTAMTRGKAYFANPNNLTQFVLMDFLKRRTSHVK